MGRFIAGFVCGVGFSIIVAVGIAFLVFMQEYPTFEASISVPERVAVGETLEMVVTATNSHDEAIVLDSIDVDEAFLEGFRVETVDPEPTDTSSIFGMRSWFFEHEVAAGESLEVRFTLKAVESGHYSGDVDVCNPNQDYSTVIADVVVEGE